MFEILHVVDSVLFTLVYCFFNGGFVPYSESKKKVKKNAYHEPLEVTCLVQFDELYLYVCYSNGNEITEAVLMQVCQWSQYCGVCTNEAKNRQRTAATFHVSVDQQDIRPALLLEDTQSHHSAKGCCQKC